MKPKLAGRIQGHSIVLSQDQDILSSALQQGLEFPNSCRVGGCGTCKCKLVSGQVKELIATDYLFSEDEIKEGYILACQSRPETDLVIEIPHFQPSTEATVVQQNFLTDDILELVLESQSPFQFQEGQHTNLKIKSVGNFTRTFSFANASGTNRAVFLIKKIPGGKLTSHLHSQDLRGAKVRVSAPMGDFYLRKGHQSVVMIAGGSGLAPLLSMLRGASPQNRQRRVTLIFAARTQKDLYHLDEIQKLKETWQGHFDFIPILSGEDPPSSWAGHRGKIDQLMTPELIADSKVYLCGSPSLVDHLQSLLKSLGHPEANIFFDRFELQKKPLLAEVQTDEGRQLASLFDYLKYFLFHVVGVYSLVCLAVGGSTLTYGLMGLLAFFIIGDSISGDDHSDPIYSSDRILTYQLWMALPLLMGICFVSVWSVGTEDALGFGRFVSSLTGFDLLQARGATTTAQHAYGLILTGLMIGMVGTITGHELTHRTWDRISIFTGRWLLAFSFDTSFAIEHVFGHHRYVATLQDPATAPRGRSVYFHIVASTLKGNLSAWEIEKITLTRKGRSLWSWRNAFLRGQLMSATLMGLAYLISGITGLWFFVGFALMGKTLLEIVNYMEHYGMVRDPQSPVEPKHSWNTNKRISSWAMFNLTRHSHHHAQGEVPYQRLRSIPDAPLMISGYLTTIVIALIPPLWHYLMKPKLKQWDEKFATPQERELLKKAA